jgi:hypothetical protein
MKLEAGKRYVTRDGQITGPLKFRHHPFPFSGELPNGQTMEWTEEGRYFSSTHLSPRDIIAEVPALTLAPPLFQAEIARLRNTILDNQQILGEPKILVNAPGEIKWGPSHCTCEMHGPTGLMAVGCTCGAMKETA